MCRLSIDAVEKMLSWGLALHCRHNLTLNWGLALALRIGIAMDISGHIYPLALPWPWLQSWRSWGSSQVFFPMANKQSLVWDSRWRTNDLSWFIQIMIRGAKAPAKGMNVQISHTKFQIHASDITSLRSWYIMIICLVPEPKNVLYFFSKQTPFPPFLRHTNMKHTNY